MHIIAQTDIDTGALVNALKEGKTIVYPTETCYGLGCDATNTGAVEKIYQIKERPKEKSFILIAASLDMLEPYIAASPSISYLLSRISKTYWPGPLTVVVPVLIPPHHLPWGEGSVLPLPDDIIRDDGTIAFRVTSHPFASTLCEALGQPLVSTSANIAGGPNPYTIDDVVEAFQHKARQPDILIDAGELPRREPTTVIRLFSGRIEILRQGDVVVDVETL